MGQTLSATAQVFLLGPALKMFMDISRMNKIVIYYLFKKKKGVSPNVAAVWFGPEQVSSACAIGVFGSQVSRNIFSSDIESSRHELKL